MHHKRPVLYAATAALLMSAAGTAGAVVFDDFEHGDPIYHGWFTFDSPGFGGGGIDPNGADLAPIPGNAVGMQTGWGSGGNPGFLGGFGLDLANSFPPLPQLDLTGTTQFSFWINPDFFDENNGLAQQYTLEINFQEDDDGDGIITAADDEWQVNCVAAAGATRSGVGCVIDTTAGWQQITIPLGDFFDDNSFITGNGILDAVPVANGGNGGVQAMVIAVLTDSGADVTFRTDQWEFTGPGSPDTDGDGVGDDVDNCTDVLNADQRDTDNDGFGNACDADVNNDCEVSFEDLNALKLAFFSVEGDAAYDPDLDFDGMGGVGFEDLNLMKLAFFEAPGPSAAACEL